MKFSKGILFFSLISSLAFVDSPKALAEAAPEAQDAPDTTQTRSVMGPIFSNLMSVLGLSYDLNEFSSEKNHAAIKSSLQNLANSSKDLSAHVASKKDASSFIAQSMSRDIDDIARWYEKGSYREARFMLQQLTENCVSCHMRLKDPKHAPNFHKFFDSKQLADLPWNERVRLMVSLRQFDEALTLWETTFASQEQEKNMLLIDDYVEYLKVALKVRENPDRAKSTLQKIAQKKNLPQFTANDMKAWLRDIDRLKGEFTVKGKELERAEKLIRTAQARMDYPLDRQGVVAFIVASALLDRTVNTNKLSAVDQSRSFYLLGLTETLLGRTSWLSLADHYFEASIRVSPGSKWSEMSLEALEQHLLYEYSGSSGSQLPDDIRELLDQLKSMVRNRK